MKLFAAGFGASFTAWAGILTMAIATENAPVSTWGYLAVAALAGMGGSVGYLIAWKEPTAVHYIVAGRFVSRGVYWFGITITAAAIVAIGWLVLLGLAAAYGPGDMPPVTL